MGKKKMSKKVAKLEKKTEDLRKKAEKKAGDLQDLAEDRIDDLTGETQKRKKRKGTIALLIGLVAAGAVALKKKRDQELDEALWEEPRSI